MKPNIVFLDEYSLGGSDLTSIKQLGNYTGYDFTTPEQVVERCREAEIVITNKVVLDAVILRQLPRLRLVCIAATGMNNVDLETAATLGIEVRNAVGYSTQSVAETTIGAALALLREVAYYNDYFHSGRYSAGRMFCFDRPIAQIRGKHWGIVGLGNIGHEVARLATAFGSEVRYYSTSGVARNEDSPAVVLDELLAWADILSIHCPLNEHTRKLVGSRELARMKSSAIIINVARGGIIDEQALADALNDNTIRGAALDVFSSEPLPASSPLLHLRDSYKLLASPHNAWATVEAMERLVASIADNIVQSLNK